MKRAIEADGLTAEVLSDAAGHRSGRDDRYRPQWRQVMRRLADSDVAGVYVDSLSRAYRSVKGWNELLERCRKYDVFIVVLSEGIDTRKKFGALQKGTSDMMATVAEIESAIASERMVDNIAYMKSKGVYWGQTPFGFTRTGEGLDAWLLPRPPYDETARTILTLWAAGESREKIAVEMNRRGLQFRTRKNEPARFNKETIRTIVNNVLLYAGYVMPAKSGRAKARQVSLEGEGSYIERFAHGMGAIRGQVKPIIDDSTASLAVERWINRLSPGRKKGDYIYLLGGRIYLNGKKLRSQTLSYGHFYRSFGAGGPVLDADRIDNDLMDQLRGVHFPAELMKSLAGMVAEKYGGDEQRKAQETVNRLTKRLENLETMRMDGDISSERYRQYRQETEAAIFEARGHVNAPTDLEALMKKLMELGALLDHATPAQRQRAFALMFDRVEVGEDGNIRQIAPAGWARQVFGELAWAWKNLHLVPPMSVDDTQCKLEGTRWMIERITA